MLKVLVRSKLSWVFVGLYAVILLWFVKIFLSGQKDGLENYWFNLVYGLLALGAGISGIVISYRKWGGHQSIIGKGVLFLSLGLISEWFGNIVWGYANIVQHIKVPYPGLADVGYFSLIPFYILGMVFFARAAGAKSSLRQTSGLVQAFLIPFAMLSVSWFLFLKDIPFDLKSPIKLFLDYGYPAGEATFVSVAILTFILSRKILGGKMRGRILLAIFGLIVQYLAESTFLYSAGVDTYYNASVVDVFYATSYFVMALCLVSFKNIEEI